MKKPKLVEVKWLDSAFQTGWKPRDTYTTDSKCRTVGYLVHKDRRCINIAMSVSEESRSETMAIPRSCIRSIRRVTR